MALLPTPTDISFLSYCKKSSFWPLIDLSCHWITWPFCLKKFPYPIHYLSQNIKCVLHSILLVLSDIHKQHYCRKCLKFHLWPPITREPGVRFMWELVYSTELIEVYRIPKIDQLLFRYLFSPKISIFAGIDLCPFDLGVRCSLTCWFQKATWQVSTTFLTGLINKTKFWPPITPYVKVVQGSTYWLFWSEGTFDIQKWGQKY